MNHNFYYEGTQIKNYLIGFASVFSEIPYQKRNGKLESVPIHYGSPSDIISYLEMNVDNKDTTNRNRTKDISVPIFSFRMSAMERNSDRRRAPLDSIAVDLRPLGYSSGYVAMKPTPFKFTMELLLWASSDYQAFEIMEQIVPYFNTPQQVTIEPLPRCPVSTTEIHLESFDIDTDPGAQKYSAVVTMSFTLTGWLLSQPRIWSSNMKFELSMLDKENIDAAINLDDTDYSVGHEIIDTNFLTPKSQTDGERSLDTIENFITLTSLNEIYGDKLSWYDSLVQAGRISTSGELLSHDELVIEYKGEEKILYPATIDMLIDDMADVLYLYENEQLKVSLATHTLTDDIGIIADMMQDMTDSIDIFMVLLDNNLITRGFNRTDVPLSNSEKLNLFGTSRINIDDILTRLRGYLASIENLKISNDKVIALDILDTPYSVYNNRVIAPLEAIPVEYTDIDGIDINYDIHDVIYGEIAYNADLKTLKVTFTSDIIDKDDLPSFVMVTIVYMNGTEYLTKDIKAPVGYNGYVDVSIPAELGVMNVFNINVGLITGGVEDVPATIGTIGTIGTITSIDNSSSTSNNGNIVLDNVNGSLAHFTTKDTDGNITTVYPDGTTVIVSTDGTITTDEVVTAEIDIAVDGTITTTATDGSITITTTDGTITNTSTDGLVTINGKITTDGSLTTTTIVDTIGNIKTISKDNITGTTTMTTNNSFTTNTIDSEGIMNSISIDMNNEPISSTITTFSIDGTINAVTTDSDGIITTVNSNKNTGNINIAVVDENGSAINDTSAFNAESTILNTDGSITTIIKDPIFDITTVVTKSINNNIVTVVSTLVDDGIIDSITTIATIHNDGTISTITRNDSTGVITTALTDINNVTTIETSNDNESVAYNFNNNIQGAYIRNGDEEIDITKMTIFGTEYLVTPNIEMSENYYKLFDASSVLDDKFINLDKYVISSLIYNKFIVVDKPFDYYQSTDSPIDIMTSSDIYKIFTNKYNLSSTESLLQYRNNLNYTAKLISDKILVANPESNLVNSGITALDASTGQHTIAPDLAVVLINDNDGNPIYDVNNDGYINEEDLRILGSNVDNVADFDFEIKFGVWYKRFRIENMTEPRINQIMGNLKLMYYLVEKEDMSELKDFLILWQKGYISNEFNILEDEKIRQEITALGYDIALLDDKLLFIRLFVKAVKNIMDEEREYILYNTPDMTDSNIAEFYKEDLEIDMLVMSKLIERYFSLINDIDERLETEVLFREILPRPMGEYYDKAYTFNLIWADIRKTPMSKESLTYVTYWLDEQLPEVTAKLNVLFGTNN